MPRLRNLWILVVLLIFPPDNLSAQESIIDTVQRASRSLVAVASEQNSVGPVQADASIDPETGKLMIARQARRLRFTRSGSGVIIHPRGYIVTNLHTVLKAHKVAVVLTDGRQYSAEIVSVLPEHDLALLKIDAGKPLTAITIANSNTVRLGDDVINIGGSSLLKETISGGVIYRIGTRPVDGRREVELIQVNMNMYRGDSGGPLLNRDGELIGMIAAKYRSKDRAALAVPSNKIKKLYQQYIK